MSKPGFENDTVLIERLKDGEVLAFDLLFKKYSQKLYRFSFSLLKNEEDSREIIQETFFRVWKNRNSIDSRKSFKSFLFTISYNLIIDQMRLRIKDQEFKKNLAEHFKNIQLENVPATDYKQLENKIQIIVEKLPEKRKMIYKMSREDGLSHKQIAEKLNISVKTVENQINLSLKQIKSKLGGSIVGILLFIALFG
ncbi:MAG: RNA polymerase sigma-70 factor [Prolixibacteraceae bacterium]|nr:RNA polymerase sigma-70 factor [Prolixibacteraceae bacterium]MBN2774009.1 RNA polymerase sigma-70 factor [Prolixibacteraceae bacterium]